MILLLLTLHSALAGDLWTTSWYGEWFRGKTTASGELFNPDELTAAHKTLPFGTNLTLTNPATGFTVTVRINDRGPFVKGRDLDISKGAAKALGMLDKGIMNLQIEHNNLENTTE